MAKRHQQSEPAAQFMAALAPPPRKSLTIDSEGEAVLTLVVPASDVMRVTAAVIALADTAFKVTLTPE